MKYPVTVQCQDRRDSVREPLALGDRVLLRVRVPVMHVHGANRHLHVRIRHRFRDRPFLLAIDPPQRWRVAIIAEAGQIPFGLPNLFQNAMR